MQKSTLIVGVLSAALTITSACWAYNYDSAERWREACEAERAINQSLEAKVAEWREAYEAR